jgi:hypothetical protein
MKKYSMAVLLFIAFVVFAEKVTFTSPAGNFSMEIEGAASNDGGFESIVVVNNIMKRLNKLDRNYLVQLKKNSRIEAKQLIDEIKYLVNSIPENVNVSFSGNQSQGVTFSQDAQINVSINDFSEEEVYTKMSASRFSIFLSDLEDESFEEERITIVKVAAQNNYFDVAQGKQIMDIFDFSDGKLAALKIIYPKIIDTDNSFQLINSFEFGDDKKRAQKIIQSR